MLGEDYPQAQPNLTEYEDHAQEHRQQSSHERYHRPSPPDINPKELDTDEKRADNHEDDRPYQAQQPVTNESDETENFVRFTFQLIAAV